METVKSCTCGICSNRCVMDISVENGRITRAKPKRSRGFEGCSKSCVRGACAADYTYRPDRIATPLRRIGKRGEGKFEAIGWDEAYREISDRLLALRASHGADCVSFFSGYSKWYRPMFHRFAGSFGSVNYGTESSSCHHAAVLADMCDTGFASAPDYANAGVLLVFARGRFPLPAKEAHRRGMKIIAVNPMSGKDIREYADLHLRPRPGTDAALAHAIARLLIQSGAADLAYIAKYVSGYDEYFNYVNQFTPEKAACLTGVPREQICAAAEMIAGHLPLSIYNGFSGTVHHRNGVQTYRAWDALNAVTGCYGRPGGTQPTARLLPDAFTPISYREFEFALPQPLSVDGLIGRQRFPVWAARINECQCMDYPAAIQSGALKAIFALGMNAGMFPDSGGMFHALTQLDFFVDCDLWLSDTAKYADIVLPVATSYERDELAKLCGNRKLWYSPKIIEPFGLARSDEDILCQLAQVMGLEDPLLCAGKEACWRWMLEGTGITLDALKASPLPLSLPASEAAPTPLETGFLTPSGKFELHSGQLSKAAGADALPIYSDPLAGQDADAYPLILMAGVRTDRYAHAFHSRTHTVPALRRLRPLAAVDLHPTDARKLGVQPDDRVLLQTTFGSMEVGVALDEDLLPGTVNMYHGYREADVNALIPGDYLDPISGFPGYKAIACRLIKL